MSYQMCERESNIPHIPVSKIQPDEMEIFIYLVILI